MDDSDPLLDVAAALADGTAVDWESVEHSIASDHDHRLLEELRFISRIACTAPIGSNTVWGPLRVIELVGRGTFGDVYRAWDSRLDREVALKILRRKDRDDEARVSTVIEEGRLLARVRHPNVVTVFGAERVGGQAGVWMEFIDGKTLEEELRAEGPFEVGRAVEIGVELAGALATVHRAGLIHRDIKTHNVMRDRDGRLVLTDFGAGCELSESVEGKGRELAGTPLCAAPEVLAGQSPTRRSDIYSLGVLLYHLVTGTYPVSGRTLKEVREAHARGTHTSLAAANPDLPAAFAGIVERSLDPDPDNRYDTAEALGSALASQRTPAGTVAASTPAMRSSRWWLVAALVVLVAVPFIWSAVGSETTGQIRSEVANGALNPEIELVQVVNLTEQGRLVEAYERALRVRSAAPGSPDAASAAAYALTFAGFVDDAVRAIDDVLAANPEYIKQNGWWTPTALLYQRDFARFLQAIGQSDTSSARMYRALAETERGQRAKAIPHLAGIDANGGDVFNGLAAALHAGLTGRNDAAVGIVQSIAQQRGAAGDADGEVTFKQAQILSIAGDAAAALATLEKAVAEGFVCVACFERSVLLESVRALPGYQRLKERALTRQQAFGTQFGISNMPPAQ